MEEEVTHKFSDSIKNVVNDDIHGLTNAKESYGDSWKKRGGVGAFMMAARKWDRLEIQVNKHNFDIFKACDEDRRSEGILDDIRDLRRYLILIESEIKQRNNEDAVPHVQTED